MEWIITESLYVIIVVSFIPLLCTTATGFCVSFLQTITQIQEQSLNYFTKLITLLIFAIFAKEWLISLMLEYSRRIFLGIAKVAL